MKIAVFFPGIGYHCDKPLLYYSGKLAGQYGYELIKVTYTGLSRVVEEAFVGAMEQTEECLKKIDWKAYDDILFVSKSIGTVAAAAYALKHGIHCRSICYTPLEKTFEYKQKPGMIFHGTEDPWAKTAVILEKCRERNLAVHVVEGVNHSLEAKDDTRQNLQVLNEVMELTEEYIAGTVRFLRLQEDEIRRELFYGFIRHQDVTDCLRREKGNWVVKPDPFIDDWTNEDYKFLVSCLKNTVRMGGYVCGAFCGGTLKGFVSVELALFGAQLQYLDLSSLHVSEDLRGRGIGKKLFHEAAKWAKEHGAVKLYISSHSAVETQAFYRGLGCVEAKEYHKEHVEREPYDCQLEYSLLS